MKVASMPVVAPLSQSLSSGKLPYDAAALLARISREIYDDQVVPYSVPFGAHPMVFEQGRSRAVGFTMEGYAFVVFRGTNPLSLADWWTDAKCWCTGRPRRHAGFCEARRKIAQQVRRWLAELPYAYAGCGVVLSGHSLGGAMAVLAAYDLSEEFPVVSVITFGAPRVGGLGFRCAYKAKAAGPDASPRKLWEVTWRFVNRGDLISVMPPALLYYHVGRPVGVSPGGLISKGGLTGHPGLQRLEYLDELTFSQLNDSIMRGADWREWRDADWRDADWQDWLEVFDLLSAFIVGIIFMGLGWLAMGLVRATILSGVDHPSVYYVQALPWRTVALPSSSLDG